MLMMYHFWIISLNTEVSNPQIVCWIDNFGSWATLQNSKRYTLMLMIFITFDDINKHQNLLYLFQSGFINHMWLHSISCPKTFPEPWASSWPPVWWRNRAQPPACRWGLCTWSPCEDTGCPERCWGCQAQTPSSWPVQEDPAPGCHPQSVTWLQSVCPPLDHSHPVGKQCSSSWTF